MENKNKSLLPMVAGRLNWFVERICALLVGAMASVIRLITKWPRLMSCSDRLLSPIQSCSSLRHAR